MNPRRDEAIRSAVESLVAWSWTLQRSRVRPFPGHALSHRQLDLLFVVAHGPQPATPSGAAAALGITAGAVTQLVEGLAGQGLLTSTANPADGRSRVLGLTEEAAAQLAVVEREIVAGLVRRFDDLEDDEIEQLVALLRRT